jgi:hypothetical protein
VRGPHPFSANRAWFLYTGAGYANELHKSNPIGVRAVRGGGGPAQPLRTGATLCDSGAGLLGACPGSPAGQDAELGLGAPHSYTDNLDGTITDNSTGLMWESLSDDGSIHDVHTTHVWSAAFDKITQLNAAAFAGHSDWRVPNLNELRSLIHYRYSNLDPVFNAGCTPGCSQLTCNCAGTAFWTSSPQNQLNGGQDEAWVVFNYGLVYPYYLTVPRAVRAVRDAF